MRQVHTATRNEIASMTGLSVATSGNILKEMLSRNEVSEYRLEEPNGGRPAHRYEYNKDYIQVACVGIFYEASIKSIWYTVVNSFGETIREESSACETVTYDIVSDVIKSILAQYPSVRSIVVSIPGKSWQESIYICDIEELEGVPLERDLKADYDVRISVEPEIDLITLGYSKSHPELEEKTVVTLLYPKDMYPGAGILIDGKLLRGDHHMAGETSFISGGKPREQALSDLSKIEVLEKSILVTSTAIISIVNPSHIALTGKALPPDIKDRIYEKCRTVIPPVSMPEFEYRPDNFPYYKTGAITMALHNTTSGLQLVSSL